MAASDVVDLNDLFQQYRLMWQSYLVSGDLGVQKRLMLAMDDLRRARGLTSEQWDAFTCTLVGYDMWWYRVRREYLDRLQTIWKRTRGEP